MPQTALSTLYIFRKEVSEIIRGILQFKWNDEFKFSLKIILSMIPAALVGLIFDEEIDALFWRSNSISRLYAYFNRAFIICG